MGGKHIIFLLFLFTHSFPLPSFSFFSSSFATLLLFLLTLLFFDSAFNMIQHKI